MKGKPETNPQSKSQPVESTTLSEMRRIAKAVHEHGKKLAASKAEPTVPTSTRTSRLALGASDDEARAIASRLAKMLETADPAMLTKLQRENLSGNHGSQD